MIYYQRDRRHYLRNIVRLKGGVLIGGLIAAVPCSALAAVLKFLCLNGYLEDLADENSLVKNNAIWSGLTFVVGFLVIFRTSQAYTRFWDGCAAMQRMRAEWIDACSALCVFTKFSQESVQKTERFKFMVVRLFSVLHAVALAEIEDCSSDKPEDITSFNFNLLDPMAIDAESLCAIKDTECKLELVYNWIQQLIVENIKAGVLSIPPPILTRVFQEMSNGMVAVHEGMRISNVPFPFPYMQTCEHLLLVHWILSPIVVIGWVKNVWTAFLFCFIQVFFLACLNLIAVEIENPFGGDANDLDGQDGQAEMNHCLALLLSPSAKRTPMLSAEGEQALNEMVNSEKSVLLDERLVDDGRMISLMDAWTQCMASVELQKQEDQRLSSTSRTSGKTCLSYQLEGTKEVILVARSGRACVRKSMAAKHRDGSLHQEQKTQRRLSPVEALDRPASRTSLSPGAVLPASSAGGGRFEDNAAGSEGANPTSSARRQVDVDLGDADKSIASSGEESGPPCERFITDFHFKDVLPTSL